MYFCWYNILRNHTDLPYVPWPFIPLNKRLLHRYFLDKSISLTGSAEMSEGIHELHVQFLQSALYVTEYSDLTSEALPKGFLATPLAFPRAGISDNESPNFSIICNLGD